MMTLLDRGILSHVKEPVVFNMRATLFQERVHCPFDRTRGNNTHTGKLKTGRRVLGGQLHRIEGGMRSSPIMI